MIGGEVSVGGVWSSVTHERMLCLQVTSHRRSTTTTAAADTSTEVAKRLKDEFRSQVTEHVTSVYHIGSPFDIHCCHVGTAIDHPVPDWFKPSFVIFDIQAL